MRDSDFAYRCIHNACAVVEYLDLLRDASACPYGMVDDYLEWVCAFANSGGDTLTIGKDDSGNVVGIDNYAELLEKLPNKMRSLMGIKPDVFHRTENGKHYLKIVVEAYPSPISLRGRYYSRSGSVTTELTGKALDAFLLKRFGKTWDSLPVPSVSVSDLKTDAIRLFRKKALESGRLSKDDLDVSDELLLRNLKLIDDDRLMLAAVMMFHPDPELWVGSAYIKIGYFGKSDADLLFQDEMHGPLIEQVEKAIELIYQKYLKGYIWYNDIQRVETYMFPRDGLRELILNSVQHKAYDNQVPIQISIYPDQIYIWNIGELPDSIPAERLYEKHPSLPRNPHIANVFFKTGMVECWGRGYEKVSDACVEAGAPLPNVKADFGGVMVHITESEQHKQLRQAYGGGTDSAKESFSVTDLSQRDKDGDRENDKEQGSVDNSTGKQYGAILSALSSRPESTVSELAELLGISASTLNRRISELREMGMLSREGSDRKGRWVIRK